MRLFCLEVKRIMKSRRTIILLTAALLLAVIMAYLPISFESINRPGDNGSVVELNGMEAIQFKREYRQDTYGDVTPQKIADAGLACGSENRAGNPERGRAEKRAAA